jgi:hypothetical protein
MEQALITLDIKQNNRLRSASYAKRNREKIECRRLARQYPLAEFCELCPDNDKRKATQRAHFNYAYPSIFLSLCVSCHKWADRKHPSTYNPNNTKLTLNQARLMAQQLGIYDNYFDAQGQPRDATMYKQLKPSYMIRNQGHTEVRYG